MLYSSVEPNSSERDFNAKNIPQEISTIQEKLIHSKSNNIDSKYDVP